MKSMKPRKGATLFAMLGVMSLGLLSAPSAQAADTGTTAFESCWADLDTGQSLCVAAGEDLFTAIEEETGLTVVFDTEITVSGATFEPGLAREVSPRATVVRAILYDDINYGGGSFVVTASIACTGTGELLTALHGAGWGDRVSSFKTYASCRGRIYEDVGGSGATYGWTTAAPSLGVMNDKGSTFGTKY